MLSHYSPLKVAETFRMIETLFPGRIDLGLGRAPGSGQRTARALQHGPGALGPEHYPAQVADLLAYLEDALPADHPFAGVRAMPTGPSQPEIWILGSSDQSALVAGWFGCAFSFAHFITDEGGLAAMETYRRNFRPSPRQVQPVASLGVFVICADTEAEARRLAASRDLWRLRLDQGIFSPFPPVEEALAYRYSERELARVSYNRRRQIVGAPEQVKESLLELGRIYQVNEFVVVTICYDFAARLRSYELLAEAFGMGRENTA
jgi:luciferase family oxidoreductase group 1